MLMGQIVIVEDDAEIANLYRRILAPTDTTVIRNILAARAYLQDHVPQLIILDFHLPGGSGLQLLEYLRSRSDLSAIPVIGISSDPSLKKNAIEQGVAVFLSKPINVSDLRNVSNRLLNQPLSQRLSPAI